MAEPDINEIRRQALEALKRLDPEPVYPQASPELYPGGPSIIDWPVYHEMQLARLRRPRKRSSKGVKRAISKLAGAIYG